LMTNYDCAALRDAPLTWPFMKATAEAD